MVSYEDWETGKVELTDEWFEPIFRKAFYYGVPYEKIIGYIGRETGTLLHPAFGNVLEIR